MTGYNSAQPESDERLPRSDERHPESDEHGPASPAPGAPGAADPTTPSAGLSAVAAFVNTFDVESGEDEIASPDGLRDFLAKTDLAGAVGDVDARTGDLDARDVERAREVREALRELLAGNAGHGTDPAALAVLDREAGRAPLAVRFGAAGPRLVAAGHGLDAALGALFGAIAAASVDGTFVRLKVCRESTCRYAFYDTSRNRSGTWCSMAVCGNRNKGRAYRRRQGAERGTRAGGSAPTK